MEVEEKHDGFQAVPKDQEEVARRQLKQVVVQNFNELTSRGLSPNDAATYSLKLAAKTVPPPLDFSAFKQALSVAESSSSVLPLLSLLSPLFRSFDALSASFLLPPKDDTAATPQPDFPLLEAFYSELSLLERKLKTDCISKELQRALATLMHRLLGVAAGPQTGRPLLSAVLINALLCPAFDEPENHPLLRRVLQVWNAQPGTGLLHLRGAVEKCRKEDLESLVAKLQTYVTISVLENRDDGSLEAAVKALKLLYEANEKLSLLPYASFYNDAVCSEDFDLKADYARFLRASDRHSFSFCRYPFVLDPATKARILQLESNNKMATEFEGAMLRSIFVGNDCPFLILRVRRDYLIQDTISQIQGRPEDLKKPLKVKFVNEEGVDEGGVQKEFFQLIVREIFDAKYGMFSYLEDTRLYWFNTSSLEWSMEYELVGMLLGLSVYNGVILDVKFPRCLYKKLLHGQQAGNTMHDLKELSPSLAQGLQSFLDFEGNVQETFCRTFQITVADVFEEKTTVDLKEGGAAIPVTAENRQEYVDLYIKHHLDTSIEKAFASFARGFRKLCGGPVLKMFRAEELELVVTGSTDLDFAALERGTVYEGFTVRSRAVRNFWKVVHAFSEDEKKKLLFFTTGSDRVPLKGLATLQLVVSKNGPDSDRLPTAHTCFNHLLLPDYQTLEKLRERLTTAINNAEGFGLQ